MISITETATNVSNMPAGNDEPVFISCDALPQTASPKKPATNKKTKNKQRQTRRGSLSFLSKLTNRNKQQQTPRDDTSIASSINSAGSVVATPESSNSNKGCLKVRTQKESLRRVLKPSSTRCRLWTDGGSSTALLDHKAVRFSTASARVFANILCDNPAVLEGPPIGLGWNIVGEESTPVVDRPTATVPQELLLAKWDRERMLMIQGYPRSDLRQAEREAAAIQSSRRRNAPGVTWLRPMLQYFENHKKARGGGGNVVVRRQRVRSQKRTAVEVSA
ncbi:expressed unknown protein [Seminavis robusta]|uniref:Uncharacterized protein n=1 Tax=Seminavis robusta TaxID=568900 RepID=A0A9N8HTG3_9STRA|nr:expressed unknown protein [Seminavis robusta]|eukprot:Sro1874_g302990.1 n/a (277) ;mRNA; f:16276-17106